MWSTLASFLKCKICEAKSSNWIEERSWRLSVHCSVHITSHLSVLLTSILCGKKSIAPLIWSSVMPFYESCHPNWLRTLESSLGFHKMKWSDKRDDWNVIHRHRNSSSFCSTLFVCQVYHYCLALRKNHMIPDTYLKHGSSLYPLSRQEVVEIKRRQIQEGLTLVRIEKLTYPTSSNSSFSPACVGTFPTLDG